DAASFRLWPADGSILRSKVPVKADEVDPYPIGGYISPPIPVSGPEAASSAFMKHQIMRTCAVSAMLASGIFAQGQRQATMVGGGTPDRGKCTIEVVVDGSAQVEVRGTSATLRTLSGQPAQWRRFECTGQMPANAPNFRFAGVDGRGKQQLMRDPRNGGVAVVQIDDSEGGAEGYTFDLFWDTRGSGGPGTYGSQPGYQPE